MNAYDEQETFSQCYDSQHLHSKSIIFWETSCNVIYSVCYKIMPHLSVAFVNSNLQKTSDIRYSFITFSCGYVWIVSRPTVRRQATHPSQRLQRNNITSSSNGFNDSEVAKTIAVNSCICIFFESKQEWYGCI